MKACAPTRANWMTAAPPPRMAKSPMRAMAGQHDVVGEDDVVADVAIVADMGVGQEGAAVADHGLHAAARGAGIHGDAFADQAVAADRERRGLALVLEVLRLDGRSRRTGKCGCARRCVVRPATTTWLISSTPSASTTSAADHAEGTDRARPRRAGRRLRRSRSRGPHILASSGSRIMALTSASATTWPFTLASP